jgi:hypothetical protein
VSSQIRVKNRTSSICLYLQKMTPEKRQNDEMFIFDIQSLFLPPGQPVLATGRRTVVAAFPMRKSAGFIFLFVPCAFALALASSSSGSDVPQERELYAGWLKMYDLRLDEAHSAFGAWEKSHPDDSLGPASNAAAYLFSGLARLGALESELFVDDSRFKDRAKLRPDPARKALFVQEIAQADRLADAALQRSGVDSNA